jgi:hypothetical protein
MRVRLAGPAKEREWLRRLLSDAGVEIADGPDGIDAVIEVSSAAPKPGAAYVVAVVGRSGLWSGIGSNLRLDCVDVLRLQIGVKQTAIEIAVAADGRTERDVEIKT